ncbi:MAG: C80 family cysteine peptidase, partial [Desulfobacterales bacterium]|nr:C80 family cysteine peptidase [Desulfobacterales bacterium]
FRDGRFYTWRGEVSLQELGLPGDWRPGDSLTGYQATSVRHGVTHYASGAGTSEIPSEFSITWNGLAWPVNAMFGLPRESDMGFSKVDILDERVRIPTLHRLKLPDGWIRIDGEEGHLFGYGIPGLDGVMVVIDGFDYVDTSEKVPPSPRHNWSVFQRSLAALGNTETGREILAGIAGLPELEASDFAGLHLSGQPAEAFFRTGPLRMVIRLSNSRSELGALVSPSSSARLPVFTDVFSRYGNSLTLAVRNMGRRLGSVAQGIEWMDVPQGEPEGFYRAKQKLAIENRIAMELGAPLKALVFDRQTEVLVPLDGSAPLIDEAYRPISPERVHGLILQNRLIEQFVEVGSRFSPDTRNWPIEHADIAEKTSYLVLRAQEKFAGQGVPPDFTLFYALKRRIQEQAFLLTQMEREESPADYRRPAPSGFPTADEMQATALKNYADWMARVDAVLDDGEMTLEARELLDREVQGAVDGYRDAMDMKFLLKGRSQSIVDYLISRLMEEQSTHPENSVFQLSLEGQEDAIVSARSRGTLSFAAQNALAVKLERYRQDTLSEYDGDFSTLLTLPKDLHRTMLEMRGRPTATYVEESASGVITEKSRGYYDTQFTVLDQDSGDVSTLVSQVNAWAQQLRKTPESRTYRWAAQALRNKVVFDGDGQRVPLYLTVVRDPDKGEVLGVALGSPVDDEEVRIHGILLDPDLHDTANATNYWLGVENDALVSFTRDAIELKPDATITFEASNGRVYLEALANNFIPEDADFEDEDLATATSIAVGKLKAQRRSALGELIDAVNSITKDLDISSLPVDLKTQLYRVTALNNAFVAQGTSKHYDPLLYYRLRQAITDFSVSLSDHVAAHPEIHAPGLDDLKFHLLKTAPHPDPVAAGFRYADTVGSRLIIQLEEDPVVGAAAAALYGKHPENTEWVWLNNDGQLVTVNGRAIELDEGSKVLLVGHGTPGAISGRSPQEIIAALVREKVFQRVPEIRRISLVACNPDDPSTPAVEGAPEADFAGALLQGLEAQGVHVGSISSRSALVMVDSEGRKWTGIPDAEGRVIWSQKNSADKLIVQRNGAGDIVSSRVPVDAGLVRVKRGTLSQALGTDGVYTFVNGEPSDSDHGLSSTEVELARQILGPKGSGSIRFVDGEVVSTGNSEVDLTEPVSWIPGRPLPDTAQEVIQGFDDGYFTRPHNCPE